MRCGPDPFPPVAGSCPIAAKREAVAEALSGLIHDAVQSRAADGSLATHLGNSKSWFKVPRIEADTVGFYCQVVPQLARFYRSRRTSPLTGHPPVQSTHSYKTPSDVQHRPILYSWSSAARQPGGTELVSPTGQTDGTGREPVRA